MTNANAITSHTQKKCLINAIMCIWFDLWIRGHTFSKKNDKSNYDCDHKDWSAAMKALVINALVIMYNIFFGQLNENCAVIVIYETYWSELKWKNIRKSGTWKKNMLFSTWSSFENSIEIFIVQRWNNVVVVVAVVSFSGFFVSTHQMFEIQCHIYCLAWCNINAVVCNFVFCRTSNA